MGRWLACVIMIAGAVGCGSPSRAPTDGNNQLAPDASQPSGEFGASCSKHTECVAGYCVEPVDNTGGVCSRECNDDCPEGYECRTVDLPHTDLKLCIPSAPQLCLACATDNECGGGACLQIDDGGRCATPCTTECPTGYACAPDASNGHTGKFCQPVTGSCTCSTAMAGAMRSCKTENGIGTCFGTETCDATAGWSACTARTAAAESCDGQDNDCNFLIDDGFGTPACTNTVAGVGSCPGLQVCDGASGFICQGQTPMLEKCNALDDDCDSKTDEAFAGLNTSCTAGVGACTRYGSQRCNSAGTNIECSAVAGPTATEACNLIDDDCDNKTDEAFKSPALLIGALGTTCSSGLGVCARYGSYVCKSDTLGTQCSAVAGTNTSTETCNYLDDNCDGIVDNGYRDPNTGFYTQDQNCGSCGTDCTTLYTAANSFGACAVTTAPGCVMRCNPGSGNLNGSTVDGCEFTLDATAIYVSVTDTTAIDDSTCGLGPTGTGTGNHPCKSITQGLVRVSATNRAKVLVADGTYAEGITLVNGKNVLGGYRADTWERHLSTTSTVISGATSAGNHDRTVVASNITSATLFEGFVVRGSFNSKPSGNSYAIYIANSTSSLVVQNNQIFAGRGGAGAQGAAGSNGTQGANGGGAASANDANYIAKTASGCTGSGTATVIRQYTNGGVRSCGADNVSGGNGGGNKCPPSTGSNFTGPAQPTEKSAVDGLTGQPGAGAGGGAAGAGNDAGDDGFVYNNATRCTIPGAPTFGVDGSAGSPGSSAPPVAGCSIADGTVVSGNWVGGAGNTGVPGDNGGGGGGGGAGGGAYCYDCLTNPAMMGGDHRIGGHGGGGGSGGCGGAAGAGGNPGGGVFGIFVTGTSGQTPTITNNTIARGDGGSGGSGGIGGAGGIGGQGGAGGQSDLFCTDKAGRGGDGGAAGHGAGGGGGCGGSSFGIFTAGVGTPGYCSTGNTVNGGAAGSGGSGGFSGGNSGGAGAAGVLQTCTSI